MADNLSISVTADTTQVRAQLAIAQADVRAYSAEVRKLANDLRSAGNDMRAGLTQELERQSTALNKASAEASKLKSELGNLKPPDVSGWRAFTEELAKVGQAGGGAGNLTGMMKSAGASVAEIGGELGVVGRALGALGPEGAAIAVGIGAATFAVTKLIESFNQLGEQAEKLSNISEAVGIPADKLRELDEVVKLAGGDVETMVRGMILVSKQAEAALGDPAGNVAQAFRAMQISEQDLEEGLKNPAQLLDLLRQRFSNYINDGKRAADFNQLLGRSFAAIVPILKQTDEEYAANRQAVISMQTAVSGTNETFATTERNIKEFEGALRGLKIAWEEGIVSPILDTVLPTMSKLFEVLTAASRHVLGLKTALEEQAEAGAGATARIPGAPLTGEPAARAGEMAKYLAAKGVGGPQQAAILASAQAESSLGADMSYGGAHQGLFQWDATRFAALQEYAKSIGGDFKDWKVQIDFILKEIDKMAPEFNKATSAAEALKIMTEKVEIPATPGTPAMAAEVERRQTKFLPQVAGAAVAPTGAEGRTEAPEIEKGVQKAYTARIKAITDEENAVKAGLDKEIAEAGHNTDQVLALEQKKVEATRVYAQQRDEANAEFAAKGVTREKQFATDVTRAETEAARQRIKIADEEYRQKIEGISKAEQAANAQFDLERAKAGQNAAAVVEIEQRKADKAREFAQQRAAAEEEFRAKGAKINEDYATDVTRAQTQVVLAQNKADDQRIASALKVLEERRRELDQEMAVALQHEQRRQKLGDETAGAMMANEERIIAAHKAAVDKILADEQTLAQGRESLAVEVGNRMRQENQKTDDAMVKAHDQAMQQMKAETDKAVAPMNAAMGTIFDNMINRSQTAQQVMQKVFQELVTGPLLKNIQNAFSKMMEGGGFGESVIGKFFGGTLLSGGVGGAGKTTEATAATTAATALQTLATAATSATSALTGHGASTTANTAATTGNTAATTTDTAATTGSAAATTGDSTIRGVNTAATTLNSAATSVNTAATATNSAAQGGGAAAGGIGGILKMLPLIGMLFEKGGIVGSAQHGALLGGMGGQMIFAHAGEMVLPRNLSEGVQGAVARGGLGAGNYAANLTHAPTININGGSAITRSQFEGLLRSHGDVLMSHASNLIRNGWAPA